MRGQDTHFQSGHGLVWTQVFRMFSVAIDDGFYFYNSQNEG
jgi:hypothetical protein